MGTATFAARGLLAAVFLIAGLAKLRDADGSRGTLEGFGVPQRLVRIGSVVLAPAELVVAIGLLLGPVSRGAGAGAAALLAVFTAGIANALLHGRRPDCGCFGGLRPMPIGPVTLARNGALLLAALAVAVAPTATSDSWRAMDGPGEVALVTAVSLAALAVALIARARRPPVAGTSASSAAHRPPAIGAPAPSFSLPGTGAAGPRTLESLLVPGSPLVLVFTTPGCGACTDLYPHLGRWQRALEERLRIAIVMGTDSVVARQIAAQHGLTAVLSDADTQVFRDYGIVGSPSALSLAADGTVLNGPVVGQDAIEDLIRLTVYRIQPTVEARPRSELPVT